MADVDVTAQFIMSGFGAEQYHAINIRHDGLWSGNNPLNGYRFMVYAGNYSLNLYSGGASTGLGNIVKTWNASPWFVRFQAQGIALRARIWQGAEPGTWEIDTTNAVIATGILSMLSMCGTTTTARPILWDNLLVQDFPTTPIYTQTKVQVFNDNSSGGLGPPP